MLNQQQPIVNSIEYYIEPLVKRVLQMEKLGLSYGQIELDTITSSCGKPRGDRFKLSIPYAKQNLTWNVLFDSQCPEMGPDFIFNDDSFLAYFDVDTLSARVPSLANWNPNDNEALLNVLIELLSCYKQYQIELLDKQDRLQVEYSTLGALKDINTDDVETILLPLGSKATEARFLIRLTVDLSQLTTCVNESKTDTAMLLITFYGPRWNSIVPQLFLSKSLEEIVGGPTLHIPNFPSNNCLMNYVPEIKKCIDEKISPLIECQEKKCEFIATLCASSRGSVIEYDAIQFSSATLVLEEQDFLFLLQFTLPSGFPKERPRVKLLSIYHIVANNTLYSEIIDNYPYCPRWSSMEMIKKILSNIVKNIHKFKANCIKNSCN